MAQSSSTKTPSRSMSFGEAIKTGFNKYADFSGTASRSEFWWWTLFTFLVLTAINVLRNVSVGDVETLGSLLAGLWSVAVLLPNLAVTVRRLRDTDHSWTNLFWALIPIAGIIILIIYLVQPSRRNS